MKKLLLIFFLSTLVISCDNSIEGKIEKQFKQFATENFDDPNSVKEIVSVTPTDTVSLRTTMRLVLDAQKACETVVENKRLLDSLYNVRMDRLNKKVHSKKYDFSNDSKALSLFINLFADIERQKTVANRIDYEKKMLPIRATLALDTLDMSNPITQYEYEIKIRQKNNEQLRLKEYYAYIDSLSQNIIIKSSEIELEEMDKMSESHKILHDLFDNYMELIAEITDSRDITEKVRLNLFEYLEPKLY